MDMTRNAEMLMAALTPNEDGELGIRPAEWRERHEKDEAVLEERDAIAQWLTGFAFRVGTYVDEMRAKQKMEQILKNILKMRPPERNA